MRHPSLPASRSTRLRAAALIGSAAMVVLAVQSGAATAAPTHVNGATALPMTASARAEALRSAQDAAASTARELGLGAQEKLVVRDVIKDADGTTHTRYERTYAGLPVLGGDLVTHVSKSGALKGVSKATTARIAVASTDPAVSATTAATASPQNCTRSPASGGHAVGVKPPPSRRGRRGWTSGCRSAAVKTPTTPGTPRAAPVSTRRTAAWAWGLRTNMTRSSRGGARSSM